jgi:hypothetical protein
MLRADGGKGNGSMGEDYQYPVLKLRKSGLIDQRADHARRELWRAYQQGRLSEEEFASTLDRLDMGRSASAPSTDRAAYGELSR